MIYILTFLLMLMPITSGAQDAAPAAQPSENTAPASNDDILNIDEPGDQELPVAPDNSANLPEEEDNSVSSATEDETAIPVVQPKPVAGGSVFENLNIPFRSLFFTPEQVDMMYSRLIEFKATGKSVKESADTTTAAAEEEQAGSDKAYYLASILMPEDGQWTIWVNDQKMRKENSDAELGVEAIESSTVTFSLKVKEPAVNIDNYATKVTSAKFAEDNWQYVSRDKNVKMTGGVVQFKLKPNQSFILRDLAIVEGNASVQNIEDENVPGGSAATKSKPEQDKSTSDSETDSKNLDMLSPEHNEAAPVETQTPATEPVQPATAPAATPQAEPVAPLTPAAAPVAAPVKTGY